MNWTWTWEAVVASLAALLALVAIVVAVRANRISERSNTLVGVYKRAILTVEAGRDPQFPEMPRIRINNEGESPARNVKLVLDADPLHLWVADETIQLIAPGDFGTIALKLPPSVHSGDQYAAWSFFFTRADGVRHGKVTWTDIEDNEHIDDVVVPPEWKPRD